MKKISILMAAAVAACGLMTSCKSDTQPRLEKPTEFVLNTPALANQTYILQEGGEGEDATSTSIQLTVSQPNYGLGVVTQYEVQASLSKDFEDAVLDEEGNIVTPANYESLRTIDTNAKINCSAFDMAVAINALNGITDKDLEGYFNENFAGKAQKVFVRVHAYVNHAPYSDIYSNVIELSVVPYFAVAVPGTIWMIGEYTGWSIDAPKPLVLLSEPENAIGSKVYSATIHIEAGANPGAFRFYTALGSWDENSIGAQVDDNAVSIALDPASMSFEGDAVDGKGSWSISNWADITGGEAADLKMTVDLSTSAYKVYYSVSL